MCRGTSRSREVCRGPRRACPGRAAREPCSAWLEVQRLVGGVDDGHVEAHLLVGVSVVQREAVVRQEAAREVRRRGPSDPW